MNPPQLDTRTSATVQVLPQVDLDGAMVHVVVIKQRFLVSRGGNVVAVPGAGIHLVDVPRCPDLELSSASAPSDLCLRKPSTDVLVVADALSPRGAKATELDVQVRVGPVAKHLRVFGTRVWFKGLMGMTLSAPEPFERQAISWEAAFGGQDFSDPKHAVEEPRNPLGTGITARPDSLEHTRAPCVEDPTDLLKTHRSRPAPAGLGPIGSQFQARLRYAGTMNQAWQDTRMPLRPLDFDERFHQTAPPGLVTPTALRGGEDVLLVNLCKEGPLAFQLPRRSFGVLAFLDGSQQELRPMLDTVLLEPNDRRLELTWRASVRAPRPSHRLRGLQVFEKRELK